MCTLVWFLRSKLEKISFSSFPIWEMTLEAGLWSLKHACTDAGCFRQRKGQCKSHNKNFQLKLRLNT